MAILIGYLYIDLFLLTTYSVRTKVMFSVLPVWGSYPPDQGLFPPTPPNLFPRLGGQGNGHWFDLRLDHLAPWPIMKVKKKVLLHDRKRHSVHGVASPGGGGYPCLVCVCYPLSWLVPPVRPCPGGYPLYSFGAPLDRTSDRINVYSYPQIWPQTWRGTWPCTWRDRHLWKHNLPSYFVRGRK